ncbi:flavodoxin family protein BilS [Butyrivibrio sp. YAB3001]|uniref:flavodoxin family protein BilS n=1 Tax=Butyrivibrio sp. YAB3001 TaxID=1520812 RepID=UPI0008F644A2|nr:flavodoxin family protein BilS [Butyrivibrio sp. YAB3001]SFB76464.1 Flavodoxin domain-containing protein [Butyrivibrio sp. YAB3001]
MLKNLVVYASETGNTKKLAEVIFDALPSSTGKDIVDVRTWNGKLDAENYFVGFWANRGSCSLEIIDILSSLRKKNIALFGTCGMGNTNTYYHKLEQNAKVWIPDDNRYLGAYFCQGKMQPSIRDKYESYRGKCDDNKIDLMLSFFDDALSHPDNQDLLKAHLFVDECMKKIS